MSAFKDESVEKERFRSTKLEGKILSYLLPPPIPSFPMSVSLLLKTVGLALMHVCISSQLRLPLEERFSLRFSTSRFCPSLTSTSVLSDSMVCKWISKPHLDKLTGKETERTRNASWSLRNNCLRTEGLKAYWWQSWSWQNTSDELSYSIPRQQGFSLQRPRRDNENTWSIGTWNKGLHVKGQIKHKIFRRFIIL